jgi:hypothetical protein
MKLSDEYEGFYDYDTGVTGKYAVAHGHYAEPREFSGADPVVHETEFRGPAGANRSTLFCARLVGAKHL